MLVSLVLDRSLPASFLGWLLSVGPTPSYLMDGWLKEHLEPPLSAWTTVAVSEWTQAGYGGPVATGQGMSLARQFRVP